MADFEGKQAGNQIAAPRAEGSSALAVGKTTLTHAAELAGALTPLGLAGSLAGRYVGTLFGHRGAHGAADAGATPTPQPSANAPATPATGGVAITAPPGTAAHRVQTAAAANDLAQVLAIQSQLRAEPAPTQDTTDGLTAARQWLMERVAAIRDEWDQRIEAAKTTSRASNNGAGLDGVEQLELAMDKACTPFLDGLMQGDPRARYAHPSVDVTNKVFAAIRLHAMRRGVNQIGHRAEAEEEARSHGGLNATDAWCGAFAYTQQEQAAGLDSRWRDNMAGEGGIRSALHYQTQTRWVWTGTQWMGLRAYHQLRGSERFYEDIHNAAPSHGIQPGDIVLIDNARGTNPDHVTTAISFDGRYLTTVGGNQGGTDRNDQTGVSRSRQAIDITANPAPNDVRQRDAAGRPIDGTTDRSLHKNVRVHGVGRWSIADSEQHTYSTAERMPTAPPGTNQAGQGARGGR